MAVEAKFSRAESFKAGERLFCTNFPGYSQFLPQNTWLQVTLKPCFKQLMSKFEMEQQVIASNLGKMR